MRGRVLRTWALIALALTSLVAVGCYNTDTGHVNIGGDISFKLPAFPETGSYAVVVFSEMHYQPSYRVQEVPNFLPPEDSVPITGAEIIYDSQEAYAQLDIPPEVLENYNEQEAAELYNDNCQVCHGDNFQGQGPIRQYMNRGPYPADLTNEVTRSATNGELYAFISFGGRQGFVSYLRDVESASPMPPFRYLLTEEERWALVNYLRNQIGPPPPQQGQ